ncbi:MAG TPA: HDOD domain-containing protein, partial [Epulopiscium sp.]|nr:HDOD domain-containing protein [Candidatus Epulonipiscium sp.]
YGLIHDIGIAVLDTCVPEVLDEITQKLKKGMHQVVAERSILGGITHSGVGAWLCERWNIPEDITGIVEFHHTPFASKTLTDELKLIYIADVISTEYYEKLLGLNLNYQISKRIMESMGLTDKDVEIIAKKLPEEIEKVKYIL